MDITKERVADIVKGLKTEKQITDALIKENVSFWIDNDSDYMNIRIESNNGYIRIYKTYDGRIEVREMSKVKCEYSGAPMFSTSNSWF